jgi:hypothetical protein
VAQFPEYHPETERDDLSDCLSAFVRVQVDVGEMDSDDFLEIQRVLND